MDPDRLKRRVDFGHRCFGTEQEGAVQERKVYSALQSEGVLQPKACVELDNPQLCVIGYNFELERTGVRGLGEELFAKPAELHARFYLINEGDERRRPPRRRVFEQLAC